jgi:hypothetical protein
MKLGKEFVGHELSSGTMRLEDLISSFFGFLEMVKDAVENYAAVEKAVSSLVLGQDGYEDIDEAELVLYEDLFDTLNDIAPEGCYFGSHVGDGACYGFWEFEAE